jgi:flavin reductase (DIM6/NTAB) family NADH-FMN oxidoreductase RutF
MLTYGLYVVTSSGSSRVGGTITWLSQCSLTPPHVLAAVRKRGSLHEAILSSGAFAVHIVGRDQPDFATTFFRKTRDADGKLNGYRYQDGITGAPLLLDAPAWIECRVVDKMRRGDHTVFIGEVVAAGHRRDSSLLTLGESGFHYGG